MARIKLELPSSFSFSTQIPVRITDVNYGGHVGNDAILSLIHEARMQYLSSLGYSEMNLAGAAVIMSDVAIEFKAELFYGDVLTVQVATAEFTRVSFDLYYRMIKDGEVAVAFAKTGMVCFDYGKKKVAAIPEEAIQRLRG